MSNLNIDDIIFLPTINISLMQQQGNDNVVYQELFKNTRIVLINFYQGYYVSKQTNCLQFAKYYQIMARRYMKIWYMILDLLLFARTKKTNIII